MSSDMAESFEQRFERWKARTLAPSVAKAPECAERTVTVSGRPIDRLYLPVETGGAGARDGYLYAFGEKSASSNLAAK